MSNNFVANQILTHDELNAAFAGKLDLTGGTLTGPLALSADPTTALQAATKQYADLMLPLAGGTMTGALTISAGGLSVSGGGTLSGVFSGGTFSTGGTFTGKQFQVSAPVTFSTSAGNAIFRYSGNISGTTTESPSTYFSGIQVANDTVVANNILIDLYQAKENFRAGATGSRTSIHGYMNVLGTPGDTGQFYLAVQGDTFSSANAGGASWSAPSGSTRGAEFSSLLGTGATFYVNNGALELSAGIQSGASAQFRSIIAIEADSTEATRGNFFDAGISFSKESAPNSPGLQYGVAFGHAGHQWYFASDSTLIAAVIRTQGIGGTNSLPLVAAVGTDYSKVKFGTAAMLMPGMSVDPTGQIFMANATIARNSTGVKIDVPNLIVTGGTVGASGAGYNANDLVYETTSGSTFSVTVDGSGHITALTLVVPGNLSAAPGGALALTGGNGTNATVNLTTAANKALSLNPSGGNIIMSALPTSASGLPSGALWNNSGVVNIAP